MTAFAIGNSDAPIRRRTVVTSAPDFGREAHPWMERARCVGDDPEIWFPLPTGSDVEAKKTCGACEVRGHCLSFAIEHNEADGVWGGMTTAERARMGRRVTA